VKKEYGLPLAPPPYKGRIHPKYNHPLFIKAIADCSQLSKDPSYQVLLDGRNRIGLVNLSLKHGLTSDIVIKEFRIQGVNKLKSIFLPSKAFKSWHRGMALVEREIDTPFPVAFLEKRKSIFLNQSFYLSEMVRDVEEIRYLFLRLHNEELQELLGALAQHLSFCHHKEIFHRDLSDGNILAKKHQSKKYSFYLIDTNRIRIKGRLGLLRRIKNLIRLGIPPLYQKFFLEQYLGEEYLNKFLWAWYKINKTSYTLLIKIKKLLRLRQLSRKLKIQ